LCHDEEGEPAGPHRGRAAQVTAAWLWLGFPYNTCQHSAYKLLNYESHLCKSVLSSSEFYRMMIPP
jgi:hypothetical protein